MSKPKDFHEAMDRAFRLLREVRDLCDEMSNMTPSQDADMELCFASNTVRGVEALLQRAMARHNVDTRGACIANKEAS